MCSALLWLPALQKLRQEWPFGFFWSFCIFLSIICTNCTYMQLFLVPYDFFIFCCWKRHLSRCKHCGKAFQIPACLMMTQKVFLMDTTTNAEQTGHCSVSTRLSRDLVVPSMPQYHMQTAPMESHPRPGKNRRRKAVMIRMVQTFYPKKRSFSSGHD